ncbi:ABC transporter permease [Streptococcus tangpeifui]|uniref:ABC transporter permease n=1 Tax=Streptococcus tangpeifui TaxID=2709400 RepID=UPI0013EAAB1D|nr:MULTISPECIES: ABC transporter permease [unclassified Streptococcus]
MITMAKRNLRLYFHNKVTVFFSLMGAWIAFGLYLIFLQKNMQDAWSGTSHPEKMLDQWIMGGTLAVASVTTVWTGITRLVRDWESHKLDDFLLTDTTFFQLNLGYVISSTVIGVIMQVLVYLLMAVYFSWQDNLDFVSLEQGLKLFALMVASSVMSAVIGLAVVQFIKTSEVVERLGVIIGTASGFLVGVYVPIGTLPDSAQTLMKYTPWTYVASAYRHILIGDQVVSWHRPGLSVQEYLGIGLKWEKLTSLSQEFLVLGLSFLAGLLLLGMSVFARKAKKI